MYSSVPQAVDPSTAAEQGEGQPCGWGKEHQDWEEPIVPEQPKWSSLGPGSVREANSRPAGPTDGASGWDGSLRWTGGKGRGGDSEALRVHTLLSSVPTTPSHPDTGVWLDVVRHRLCSVELVGSAGVSRFFLGLPAVSIGCFCTAKSSEQGNVPKI